MFYYLQFLMFSLFPQIAGLLIAAGTELDSTNTHGNTALNTAAFRGHQSMVDLLLDAKCNVNMCNSQQQTPLINAASNGKW